MNGPRERRPPPSLRASEFLVGRFLMANEAKRYTITALTMPSTGDIASIGRIAPIGHIGPIGYIGPIGHFFAKTGASKKPQI